jgi:hypothetical protein
MTSRAEGKVGVRNGASAKRAVWRPLVAEVTLEVVGAVTGGHAQGCVGCVGPVSCAATGVSGTLLQRWASGL